MVDFNSNPGYCFHDGWNAESRIFGQFGDFYLQAKFYRFDGTLEPFWETDYRAKRGILIRNHYSPRGTAKIHIIAGNLEDFLTSERIQFTRINFKR